MTFRPTSADAVEQLEAGNMRFVAGEPRCGPYGPRVAEFASDPYPFAVVLGCSDARAPIETVFDRVPGNIFGVRVAGNFVDNFNLASTEFAVDVLKASLVLVLGHSHCGALRVALTYVRDGTRPRGRIAEIIDALGPSVRAVQGLPGDWLENAIAHNVARNVEVMITGSEIISEKVNIGEARVIGGVYNIATGRVAFL